MIAFNPFDPTAWMRALSRPVFPHQTPVSSSTPIAIRARASDPGIDVSVDRANNAVTFRGTTDGFKAVESLMGSYEVARGVSFTLDIEKAPTVDVFGATNYTKKNARIFQVTTSEGWPATEVAERLAAKVNQAGDFKAQMTKNADGSATLTFCRR